MRIQQQLREVDIACRAGGDAFSFILPHTNSAQARIAIERIDKAIREQPFIIDSHSFHFHAHFGIAEATSSVENAHELFRRAEHAERMSREDGCPIPIITYPDPENGVTDSVA
jgi:diguanylate cyclase (GGDEF)-like protein